jgi:hypothetical protein
MILIRKINKAKWKQNDICNGESVSADAITLCLKTSGNTLSTWKVTEDSIENGVLAIILPNDFLDSIDVVLLTSERLESEGIKIKQTNVDTMYQDYSDKHYDLIDLNYDSLGVVADLIVDEFKANKVKRITKGQLKNILRDSIEKGLILKSDLHERIQKNI